MKKVITSNRKSCRAFTLIEIMVATVIMVVLVGLVIQITSEVLKVWNRSSGKLSTNAEARIAMDLLTQDLETAIFRNNGQQWLRVEAPVDPGGEYTDQTVALKLFAPALDRPEGPGDICAIGYRLAFKQSYDQGPNVYALYRRVIDPATTFDEYLGSSNDPGKQDSLDDATLWAEFGNDSITDDGNYLVGNIIEFKVLVYEKPATPGGAIEPVNATPEGLLEADYAYGGNGGRTAQLLYADILLTVVSDQGLQMIENIDKLPETVDEVVALHGDVFIRRVNFQARPL